MSTLACNIIKFAVVVLLLHTKKFGRSSIKIRSQFIFLTLTASSEIMNAFSSRIPDPYEQSFFSENAYVTIFCRSFIYLVSTLLD